MSDDEYKDKEIVRIKFPFRRDERGYDFVDILREDIGNSQNTCRDMFDKGKSVEARVCNCYTKAGEEAHYKKRNKERIDLSKAHRMEFKGEFGVKSSE